MPINEEKWTEKEVIDLELEEAVNDDRNFSLEDAEVL